MKCECSYLEASANRENVLDPRVEVNVKRTHFEALVSRNRAEFVASNFPRVEELIAAVSGFGNYTHVLEARW